MISLAPCAPLQNVRRDFESVCISENVKAAYDLNVKKTCFFKAGVHQCSHSTEKTHLQEVMQETLPVAVNFFFLVSNVKCFLHTRCENEKFSME